MQILMDRGLEKEEADVALSTAAHSDANVTATATTDALTASTGALGASLKGLWTTIKTHPVAAVLTAIAASAIILYSQLKRYISKI